MKTNILLFLLFFAVASVRAIDLRGLSNLDLCDRHIRDSKRIIFTAEMSNDQDNRIRKARLIVKLLKQVEAIVTEECPTFMDDQYLLLLREASSIPSSVINWNVSYDTRFFSKLRVYSNSYELVVLSCRDHLLPLA